MRRIRWRLVAQPVRDGRVDREGVIYLDGNSLGVLPKAAIGRIRDVVEREWGSGLIRSWNTAGWITLAQRIGDKIATLVGAQPRRSDRRGLDIDQPVQGAERCGVSLGQDRRRRIISERTNFPTDLYIADTFATRARQGAGARRPAGDSRAAGRSRRDPDADARQLPHRSHARDAGADARRRTMPARS